MKPKLIILMAITLLLLVVAIGLVSRGKLPWPFIMSAGNNQAVETPTIAPSIQPATPWSTPLPVTPFATSTPITGQKSPVIPCFTFEELPPFAFTPDGSRLMVRVRSGVQVFNLVTGSLETFIKSSQELTSAALSPDGEVLAWALADNSIQLLRVADQQVLHTLAGPTDMVTKLRFSPDGASLVSASHDYWVRIWSLSGELLRSIQTDALGIGISPDGRMLATIPFDGPVTLWDLATGEKIKEFGGTGGYDTSDAVFSPDGRFLAADLATGLFLWRISDASLVWNDVKNSMAIAFSPDGQYLAYSNIDDGNKVVLAAADTAQPIQVIDTMQSPVWELIFSPDASLIAVTDGMEIHIIQVADGERLAVGKSACP